jgi:phosphohistidine phosphatase SixA
MGQTLRALAIPIAETLSSPTYRARETARLAALIPEATTIVELGDGDQRLARVMEGPAAWLRRQVSQTPKRGNTLIVTHLPNIAMAFPHWGAVDEGEVLVLRPDGQRSAQLVSTIKIAEWTQLR